MLSTSTRGFEIVKDSHLKNKEIETTLPTRSDNRSAGYDFYSKETVEIEPGNQHFFFTDVKAFMEEDELLSIHVRSSIGIKTGLSLANTTGIIDSSYYENEDNDGNIIICLKNNSDHTVIIQENDRIAQGVFSKYLVTYDDNPLKNKRSGGIGSSGK